MDLAGRLRFLREERGLTQAELGQVLGLSKQTISSYENRGSNPDPKTLQQLAAFFAVTTDYLLGLSDTRNPNPKLPAWVEKLPPDLQEFVAQEAKHGFPFLRLARGASLDKMEPWELEALIETWKDAKRRYKKDMGEKLDGE